jgi:hypothetical protein
LENSTIVEKYQSNIRKPKKISFEMLTHTHTHIHKHSLTMNIHNSQGRKILKVATKKTNLLNRNTIF